MTKTSTYALLAVSLSVFVIVHPNRSLADERCQQLEALHAQYVGVQLTFYQQQIKRRLVAWYYSHCGGRHVADRD
jgi:hypothetical protein